MMFTKTFISSTYVVSNALLQPGQSVAMDASHVAEDGSLRPLAYVTAGGVLTIDAQGVERRYSAGSSTEGECYAAGGFTLVVVAEETDYWCINPFPGHRLVRTGAAQVIPQGGTVTKEITAATKALFMGDAVVNGVPIARGMVASLSPGSKCIEGNADGDVHVVLFNVISA